ncbi:GTP-binding protein LepA [Angomonas deanei]|uniref:Translation factor GUF1 homolog, mitochondrial n=1 Tax=Angomonas deanei TaxID=59799 RepID=A0A7G2CE01_9TRYP|nr:GTP-binding protein LepA [Angomonas deanei]CAD2216923.1 Elongation factor Tu GTP binding domain/Elongation factor G C-terminus/GTP-binding protein LepA C-terminus, putative [Angomonas deanei]|eukprot:EPY35483.1 GTP-binding protein LepA [Angomonas deanei]
MRRRVRLTGCAFFLLRGQKNTLHTHHTALRRNSEILSVSPTFSRAALCTARRANSNSGGQESHFVSKYEIPPDAHLIEGAPRPYPSTPTEIMAYKKKMLRSFDPKYIRNVSVVAHVDHGKTTLTDAILRRAGLLPEGATGAFTDRLSVEKERGITIKAQTCSIFLKRKKPDDTEEEFLVNLIDTPGHVDFQYEVSRSLSASEAALLLLDVCQGVEAQTMAQFYAALDHDLTVVPILTKLDQVLSDTQVDRTLQQLEDSTGLLRREVVLTSAKAKKGVEAVLEAILDRVPPPQGREGLSDMCQHPSMHPESEQRRQAEESLVPLRALLFDCWTAESSGMQQMLSDANEGGDNRNDLRKGGAALATGGVYCLVRVMDGTVTAGTTVTFFHSRKYFEVREVGIIHPVLHPTYALTAGMVGYVFLPGLSKKDIRIGDTLCTVPIKKFSLASPTEVNEKAKNAQEEEEKQDKYKIYPVPGFKQAQPVVFAGFYPDEEGSISRLREAVDLLCINDPSVTVDTLQCQALGAGLQLGFLGLLHMQVFKERLLAEFDQTVLMTPPQVQYRYVPRGADPEDPQQQQPLSVENWVWPHEGADAYLEPIVHATVVTPRDYFNAINQAALQDFRGVQDDMRVLDDARVLVRYTMPLADLARGYFSAIKSLSRGYAALEYDDPIYVQADLVKVDIVINKAKISALSLIAPRQEAPAHARRVLTSLKSNLLRSTVDLPIQALIGGKIIGRETIKAYRKDVTAKIHAGDISRKQKKWSDQKKGKRRWRDGRWGPFRWIKMYSPRRWGRRSLNNTNDNQSSSQYKTN